MSSKAQYEFCVKACALVVVVVVASAANAKTTSLGQCRVNAMEQIYGNDSKFTIGCKVQDGKFSACSVRPKVGDSVIVTKARLFKDGVHEDASKAQSAKTFSMQDLWQGAACGGVSGGYVIYKKEAMPAMERLVGKKHASFDDKNKECRLGYDLRVDSATAYCNNDVISQDGWGDYAPFEIVDPTDRKSKIVLSNCTWRATLKKKDEIAAYCTDAQRHRLLEDGTVQVEVIKYGRVEFDPVVCDGAEHSLSYGGGGNCVEKAIKALKTPYSDLAQKLNFAPEHDKGAHQ